ncbi:nuclear hormone receptor FTZ-F1-like [Drosophila nasuta]|uniref:nuclear hormone receptor FTZ-F1-like n=1 Tax=Drosophila nasuta TaxID=42062 RepID=UPI00295E375E|nr:nuclear hormone receptor FTZ-F1-like [Drosophila nasuta]
MDYYQVENGTSSSANFLSSTTTQFSNCDLQSFPSLVICKDATAVANDLPNRQEQTDALITCYQSLEDESNSTNEFDTAQCGNQQTEGGSFSGGDASSPASGSGSRSGSGNGDSMDLKQLFEELCPVCGDKVSGYHYGLLTCESCKGFFKRTVQNKKVYTCVAERACQIDKTQRKRCPYCRFEKCLEVGMKLEAVRADRMRGGRNMFGPMYKRNRARKLQAMRQRQLALQSLHSSQDIQIAQVSSSPGCGSHWIASDNNNTAERKLCLDSTRSVSPMIREFVEAQLIDDREWQTQLFGLLQKQTHNQVQVDLFELMCKVLDQNLFSQVDWARNSVFFKHLHVDDQMKLLQHSWSDLLVLDHLHHRIHNALPDVTHLHNGQVFDLMSLGLLGVPRLRDYFDELQHKLIDLKFDMGEYVCMKFMMLLSPDSRINVENSKIVLEGHERVQAALLDYTLLCYPSMNGKFSRLLTIIQEIHAMASRGEEYLYAKHCAGNAPTRTLLMEMLHAKRKV